jgi:hypothetical protein
MVHYRIRSLFRLLKLVEELAVSIDLKTSTDLGYVIYRMENICEIVDNTIRSNQL